MESYRVLSKEQTLNALPPTPGPTTSASDVRKLQGANKLPILVVLDDDPTGTQTCHGVNVLTVWDQKTLIEEFKSAKRGFFILTNSRALPTSAARNLIRTICQAVKDAAEIAQKSFEFVLRGDSTLRGHFLDELEVAQQVIGKTDACILAPFFGQGGRFTINDVHYVADGDGLVPAAQTHFAKDTTFGYKNSNLKAYIVEKSKGAIPEHKIESISLVDIRLGGRSAVTRKLSNMSGSVVIVNAVVDEDMEIFVQGMIEALKQGKKFIYRTAATFVSTRLGIEQITPLGPKDLGMDLSPSAHGGLIIAGSYVPKTTAQLKSLEHGRSDSLKTITIEVEDLLVHPEKTQQIVLEAADRAGELIVEGRDVLFMTNRRLITAEDKLSSFKIESMVAQLLVDFLRLVNPRPRYIIAKGGITSSDAARKALRMRRAEIAGQAAAGVPLWRCHEATSKWTSIPYVVFPGNAGEVDTLRDLVAQWATRRAPTRIQYQRLGCSALKVSRIILGCMSFGNPEWEGSPWVLPEVEALPILKNAYELGINTWDTANTYSNGASELLIGKALRKYSIPRSKVVIMTKVYYPVMDDNSRPQPAVNDGPLVNQMGLSRKHIFEAVEASLKRLSTDYIDVLQLHRIDSTEAEPQEIMSTLHDLVKMGKVLYVAGSSMRTWEFARLQYTAKVNGWTGFTSMQNLYNLLYREEEREMNPFCRVEGIGLTPWSPVARGLLTRPWNEKTARSEHDSKTRKWFGEDEQNRVIVERVEELAKQKNCTMSALSLAWLLKKGCTPIVGMSSEKRMLEALEALEVEKHLSASEMMWLEETYRSVEVQAI